MKNLKLIPIGYSILPDGKRKYHFAYIGRPMRWSNEKMFTLTDEDLKDIGFKVWYGDEEG